MDSSIASRFDYGLLDSLEWSEESFTLSSFLEHLGSSFPHVVKVLQGFCGDACSETIDSSQILILHSLQKETKILAKNAAQDTELFIPKDFQVKVEMIPKNSLEESTSVRELLQTFPKYFRALSDIPSHNITSGNMFKIIRQKGYGCFECLEIINDGEEREVRLPFSLKGRFQALQDNREFLIDEVYAEEKDNLEADVPVNIHFVKSCLSGISVPGLNTETLYDLGTLRLVGECEIETVFATLLSSEDGKILAIFPKDLEITVHSAKTNAHYESVRHAIKETQTKTLKRIERLNKLSIYQAKNPVRQFSQNELEPPALPGVKTRTKSATQGSIESTAKRKSRSYSTPSPPPRVPRETKHVRNKSSPRPVGVDDQNIVSRKDRPSLKRPTYKPPDIPHQGEPPLPPKERSKHLPKDQDQTPTSGQDLHKAKATEEEQEEVSGAVSPPIPPPRLRRRQKSLGTRKDIRTSACSSSSYEQMEGFAAFEQAYEEMDGSWIGQEGTLEDIFGVATVDGDLNDNAVTEDKMNRKEQAIETDGSGSEVSNNVPTGNVKEIVIVLSSSSVSGERKRADSVDYENTKELKLDHSKKGNSEKTVLQNDVKDQRERVDSMDYENTKELKLARLKKEISEKALRHNDVDNQRERADSMDFENTKELKLAHLKKEISDDLDDQRKRVDSMDYENTKELKLARLKGRETPEKMALQNDVGDQRERVDSMDYENTKELKLARLREKIHGKPFPHNDADDHRERADSLDYENIPKATSPGLMKDQESALSDDLPEGIVPRSGSIDYENTKELKLVPPGTSTLSDDICQGMPKTKSIDYENTKELKLKIPSNKAKQNQASNNELSGKDKVSRDNQKNEDTSAGEVDVATQPISGEDGVTKTEQASTLVRTSLASSSRRSNDDTNDASTKLSAFAEVENKPVAKTEQFLKELKLGREGPSGSEATIRPEGTKESSSAEENKNRASDEIYYTTMAENVADPTYYTTMANRSLQGDIYERMNADENDTTYMPMNDPCVENDLIYENDVNDSKGDDSDEMDDYEKIDSVVKRTPRNTTQMTPDKDENHSDAYEEVDIIQKIESSLDKKDPCYEPMDISQVKESMPSSRVQSGYYTYEEVDPPLTPGPCYLEIIATERPGSDSYEDIDFPTNIAQSHLTKSVSNEISAPPTPPQRRARKLRKSLAGEANAGDSKNQPEVLSSSLKSCDQIGKLSKREDFEDVESLQIHMAVKESERQLLFEKALAFNSKKQQPPSSESPKESTETAQQEPIKDKVSTAALDQVTERYVKSRPPAPPPRKPVNYLDVETTKPPSKSFKQKPPCNYSEVIGKVQAKHSSKEDDMEYIDDIELHYFQKERMKMEKKRIERKKEKNENAKDCESNDVTIQTVKKDEILGKIPSSSGGESGVVGESEIGSSVAANIQKFQNNPKDGFQESRKPVTTKPLPKKPIVKKKPTRTLSEPITSKNDAHRSITSSNEPTTIPYPTSRRIDRPIISKSPSPDANNPSMSNNSSFAPKQIPRHRSERPAVAKKPVVAKRSLNPPPKPKRTFVAENTHEICKVDLQNTQKTCSSSKTAIQDTPPWNGKGIPTLASKHSSSEEKVACQRTKPPKPLPRRKSELNIT